MIKKKKTSIQEHQALHTKTAIRQRLQQGPSHSYLRDFIYGAIDGTVTTFAVVSGVAGAHLSENVIIILGIANLIGDGFSMAAGNYLGTTAEHQLRVQARKKEEEHIMHFPEGEKEEIRQIFSAKGFKGQDLEIVVDTICSDKKQWIDTMLKEELGMPLQGPSPKRAALATFSAFIIIGAVPLIPFLYRWAVPEMELDPFLTSTILTAGAFFAVGAYKGRFVENHWYISGLETLIVGGAAAALAYIVGLLLRSIGIASGL